VVSGPKADDVNTDVRIRSAVPTFLVVDVAETARWYAAALRFETTGKVPDHEPYVYASVQRGPAEIMLLAYTNFENRDPSIRRAGGLWDAYIRVDGVKALYATLEGKPFVQTSIARQRYGDWEFEVRDPNGYVLVFGGSY
jgi:uncharacterized glyoxalase superfamily protein PhnB